MTQLAVGGGFVVSMDPEGPGEGELLVVGQSRRVPSGEVTEKTLRAFWFEARNNKRTLERRACVWGVEDEGETELGWGVLREGPIAERYRRLCRKE